MALCVRLVAHDNKRHRGKKNHRSGAVDLRFAHADEKGDVDIIYICAVYRLTLRNPRESRDGLFVASPTRRRDAARTPSDSPRPWSRGSFSSFIVSARVRTNSGCPAATAASPVNHPAGREIAACENRCHARARGLYLDRPKSAIYYASVYCVRPYCRCMYSRVGFVL